MRVPEGSGKGICGPAGSNGMNINDWMFGASAEGSCLNIVKGGSATVCAHQHGCYRAETVPDVSQDDVTTGVKHGRLGSLQMCVELQRSHVLTATCKKKNKPLFLRRFSLRCKKIEMPEENVARLSLGPKKKRKKRKTQKGGKAKMNLSRK